jgi:hypothetical protein
MNNDLWNYKQQQYSLKSQGRTLDDIMRTRIRAENRAHADMRQGEKVFGVPSPDRGTNEFKRACAEMAEGLLYEEDANGTMRKSGLLAIEHQQYNLLMDTMRTHAGPHLQMFLDIPGIGDRLVARLLSEVGGNAVVAFPAHWEERPDAKGTDADPLRVLIEDEPYERTVSQLWTYCGHGKALKKVKGMTQEEAFQLGNPRAKMLAHLIAEGCMKSTGGTTSTGVERTRSPYRDVYEEAKTRYEATRPDPPKGQKDTATEWSKLHRHNAALRITAKEVLRDLWRACKADLQFEREANNVQLAA